MTRKDVLFDKIKNKIKPNAKTACPNAPGNLAVYVLRADTQSPIANAKVKTSGTGSKTASTDGEGWAIFKGVKPGPYQADVALPPLLSKFAFRQAKQAGSVPADGTEIIEFEASPPPALKIKLIGRQQKGGKLEEQALSGVQLEVSGKAQHSPSTTQDWVTLNDLEPGNYRVAVKALGAHAQRYGLPAAVEVSLAAGETKEALLLAPPKPVWVKLKFADDLNGDAVGAVKTSVTFPNNQTRDYASSAGNLVEVPDIEAGTASVAAACSLKGARLETTLNVVGAGEAVGGKQQPDDRAIPDGQYIAARVTTRKVRKGDTLESIAAEAGLSWQDLAMFNFGTADKAAVNSAVRERVGSRTLAQDKTTYMFADADKPGLVYVPKEWKAAGLATEKTHTVRVRPIVARWLTIARVDDHFAPGAEKLDIAYSIHGLSKRQVFLEIKSEHYSDNPIFKRELTAAEALDGKHTIHWDGKSNCAAGDLKGRHVNPLFAPYKVRLYVDDTYSDEDQFKVLCHSITLHWAPHLPDGKAPAESEKAKYAQYRLNELGWDAGPVDGTATSAATKAALHRFQRSHYKTGTKRILAENGALDDDTFEALKTASPRARWEAGKNPLTADAKLYVEDNYFNDRGANFVTTGTPQFNSMDRKTHVEDKLGRPYLPLEAEVRLLAKNNSGVSAPLGVGPVTIAWEAADDREEEIIAATNGTARAFVRSFVRRAPPFNQTGDNAPRSLEGVRESALAANVKSWFPDDAPSKLEPWKVRAYDTEARAGATHHRALVDAWADPSKHDKRLGRAGVYFRHSTKGGDDAKIRAAVTFEGRPNKDQLVKLHDPYKAALVKETGRWTVWRRAKMNAYCEQATPSRASGSPNWATIAAWWRDAFIEMERGGAPADRLDYATVVTEAKYKAAIVAMPASHRPPGVTAGRHLKYRAGSLYGGPDISQNAGESPQDYIDRASAAVTAWIEHPLNAILGVIHGHVRETRPEGLIVFDFRISEPITAKEWDPKKYILFGGFNPTTNAVFQNVLPSTAGYVRLDGAVTMNVDNPFDVNCYVLHECGHARFLYHHHTGGGTVAGGASDNPAHHDPAQEQCAMSYAVDGHGPSDWKYPFCGKCILRLRGWKVT